MANWPRIYHHCSCVQGQLAIILPRRPRPRAAEFSLDQLAWQIPKRPTGPLPDRLLANCLHTALKPRAPLSRYTANWSQSRSSRPPSPFRARRRPTGSSPLPQTANYKPHRTNSISGQLARLTADPSDPVSPPIPPPGFVAARVLPSIVSPVRASHGENGPRQAYTQ